MDVLHVAVDVEDMETTTGFYEDLLGLHHTRDFEVDGSYNYCVGGEGPAQIQFCEVEEKAPPAGINHLSVAVDDVDAVVAEAAAEWDSTIESEPVTIGGEARLAFITDPEGYSVELIEQLE